MKRKLYPMAQIIRILREAEAGGSTLEVCRKHGFSPPTFYDWNAKYGVMGIPDANPLKELELENSRLKRVLADAALDNAALKDLLGRKWQARRQGARQWRS